MGLKPYDTASDDAKAKAVNFLYDTYYDLAKADRAGDAVKSKDALFLEAIDAEWLALAVGVAGTLESDKAQVKAYINSLKLTREEKQQLHEFSGYKE